MKQGMQLLKHMLVLMSQLRIMAHQDTIKIQNQVQHILAQGK